MGLPMDRGSQESAAVRLLGDLMASADGADAALARARFYAGVYADAARPGLVVDEKITAPFSEHLPAALARRGLLLERDALRWIVRRAPAPGSAS